MEMKKDRFYKLYTFFCLVIMLFLFSSLGIIRCNCSDENEIKNWSWGGVQLNNQCPVNKLPIEINPASSLREATEKAIDAWNKEFDTKLFIITQTGYPVKEATSDLDYFYKCEPIKLGDGANPGQNFKHVMAWTEFEGTLGAWDMKTFVCLEKYNKGVKLMNTPAAQRIKYLGLYGIIKHELGHYLIGPDHPKAFAELMSEDQEINAIHFHTKQIVLKTVVEVCK